MFGIIIPYHPQLHLCHFVLRMVLSCSTCPGASCQWCWPLMLDCVWWGSPASCCPSRTEAKVINKMEKRRSEPSQRRWSESMPLCDRNMCIRKSCIQNQSCAALTVLNSMASSPTYTCYIIHDIIIHNLYSFTVSTVLTICIYLFGLGPHPWKHSTSGGSRKTWRAVWDIRPVTGRGASMAARSWHAITSESRESNE